MSVDNIYKIPYTEFIGNKIFDAKNNELIQVADKYNLSINDLKIALNKKLSESNMKVGGCNLAIDFLIVDTIQNDKMYKSVEEGISQNILMVAMYYTNGINKPEYI